MNGQGGNDDIEAEIDALRQSFAARLPGRVDAADAAAVADAAHAISGSAGLFGYHGLAAAAEALKAAGRDAAAATRIAPLAEAVYARAAEIG